MRVSDDAPRALVTGAAGFIGRHLVNRLLEEGWRVVAADASEDSPLSEELPGADHRRLDIRDLEAVRSMLAGVDTVFNLAAVHLDVHAEERAFEEVNVRAAGALVDLCSEAGVRRLIHTSSVGVYGHVEEAPAAEDAAKHPETPYERTKLDGERAVLERARQTGMDVVVLRPAWVFGPGCRKTAKLLRSIRKGRFFYIGRGENLRHPIYISDMVEAFLLAARMPPSPVPRLYNIAGPRVVTLRELVEACARVMEVPAPRLWIPRRAGLLAGTLAELASRPFRRQPPFSRRSLAFFFNDNAFSIAAAERDLGFRPSVDLETGLRRTLAGANRT